VGGNVREPLDVAGIVTAAGQAGTFEHSSDERHQAGERQGLANVGVGHDFLVARSVIEQPAATDSFSFHR